MFLGGVVCKYYTKMNKTNPIWPSGIMLLLATLLVFAFSSCDDDEAGGGDSVDFDRGAMLRDAADELIIPNFTAFQGRVNELSSSVQTLLTDLTADNLFEARVAWNQTAREHQNCSAFGFGPGELLLGPYATVLGAFPVSPDDIEANAQNPDFDLANAFETDIRGLYTIEYFLYNKDLSDQEVLDGLADPARQDYLLLITNELRTAIDGIVTEWNNGYRDEFVETTGTFAGSPISLYYNSFVKDYENIKNFKLELPGGLSADAPTPDPSLVESFYAGFSRPLIEQNWENIKNIYLGRTRDGEEIIGFDDYARATVGGPELVDRTLAGIEDIDAAVDGLPPNSLFRNIEDPGIRELRDVLQDNTANFKSSLSSLLGISITFNSGDGD